MFAGPNSIPADIVFIVKDKDHPLYKRNGADLHYVATVPLSKALIGCVIEVGASYILILHKPDFEHSRPVFRKQPPPPWMAYLKHERCCDP